jgi:hypothetical protein
MVKLKSPRELAARALCASKGLPENNKYEGRPMWQNFLVEVDVVLAAALSPDEWIRVRREGPEV